METQNSASRPRVEEDLLDLDRLIFLTDGVLAISLTLLILDLRLPVVNTRPLEESLQELLPRLAIYLFAFATIANQWAVHHRTFRHVRHGNGNLVLLSLIDLLFITLIPASASIVGGYPTNRLAAACFAVNSLMLCLSAAAIWWYVAAHSYLLAEGADPRILKGIAYVWLTVGLGFVISLGVGTGASERLLHAAHWGGDFGVVKRRSRLTTPKSPNFHVRRNMHPGTLVGTASVYAECAVWLLWSPVISWWWHRRRLQLEA
jgi:uncharacterized membrane protein